MKKDVLKYGGIAAIVLGGVALFLSGTDEASAMEILAGVFILMGVIANILGDKLLK